MGNIYACPGSKLLKSLGKGKHYIIPERLQSSSRVIKKVMKVNKEYEIKFILELSEMELACLFTVIRKANAEFISNNSDGEGYSVYEKMLKEMEKATKK